MTPKICCIAMTTALLFLSNFGASASPLDLRAPGTSGWVNGAFFQQVDPSSTLEATDTFVQAWGLGVTHAYNTTRHALDNGFNESYNHELALSDLSMVMIDTETYYEFLLDINQYNCMPYLSLDEVQIFVSDVVNQNVASFDAPSGLLDLNSASLVYRLDAGNADNWIWLNHSLNAGSGSGDMLMYVPTALFADITGSHVYLYSRFGENWWANDGAEEWSIVIRDQDDPQVVPEPGTLALLALGLAGICRFRYQIG